MIQNKYEILTNLDIALYSLYLLGGTKQRIHTEDVALKCFELAPTKFSWIKYPEYPDITSAYFALGDAKKNKFGGLVIGKREIKREKNRIGGWIFTLNGINWVNANKSRIEDAVGKHGIIGKRLNDDRKLRDLFNSTAYKEYLLNREHPNISFAEFTESLICTVNTSYNVLVDKLNQLQLLAKISQNKNLKDYIKYCEKEFLETETGQEGK